MAGHSLIGQIARGYWSRLYARAIYLEDAGGQGLALVQCDLWAISGGLSDRVAQLLATEPVLLARLGGRTLGREQIVLAASHTHHSPGLFSTDLFFASFSGSESGFDEALFEFLAHRIASSIAQAVERAGPARVYEQQVVAPGAFRNRSMEAFRANPEARALIEANAALPLCPEHSEYPDLEACRAVDPRVVALRIDSESRQPIGALVVFAAHPTLITHLSTVYSADLHGAVATLLEQRMLAESSDTASGRPVVAVFNGAEGDVSGIWVDQTRADVLKVARSIVDAVWPSLRVDANERGRRVDGPIDVRFERVELRGQRVSQPGLGSGRTAWIPMPGRASAGGAEDGRSGMAGHFVGEGKRGIDLGAHGTKIGTLDLVELFGVTIPPFWLTRLLTLLAPPPSRPAIGVYRLGPLRLAALPGEFSTVQGRRIAQGLAPRGGSEADVVLLGLANGYAYYFTTPEEYDLQHYEGASTLYGRWAGPHLQSRLTRLAGELEMEIAEADAYVFEHRTGVRRTSDTRRLIRLPDRLDEGTRPVEAAVPGDAGVVPPPRTCWRDAVPRLGNRGVGACASSRGGWECATPRVGIEVRASGAWRPHLHDGVPEDDRGLRFLTLASRAGGASNEATCWCSYWLAPDGTNPEDRFRFSVETLSGRAHHSEPFGLETRRFSGAEACDERG